MSQFEIERSYGPEPADVTFANGFNAKKEITMQKPRLKILMAEDDQNDYLLVEGMLNQAEGENFQLERAQDYDTALSMIERNAHDVYLLDYKLGGGDGIELLRKA